MKPSKHERPESPLRESLLLESPLLESLLAVLPPDELHARNKNIKQSQDVRK